MSARAGTERWRNAPLGLALGFVAMLAAGTLAGGNLRSPFGWVAYGMTAAVFLRWGMLPGVAAALGAALAVLLVAEVTAAIVFTSICTMLAGGLALQHLAAALGVRRDLGRCTDVARLVVAVTLAMAVPAALTLAAFAVADGTPTPAWAGLHGLTWCFQATMATLALVPPLLAFDTGTLDRWRRQPLEVLGLALAAVAIATLALLRLPALTWVALLGLPVVAAAAMRVDLAFAGLLALLCFVATTLGVEWAAVDGHYALAAHASGRLWSYSMVLSGLMLTVHALRSEHAAVERDIQVARARYRIGMLSTAVHEQERVGRTLRLDLGLGLGELAGALQTLDAATRRHAPQLLPDVAAMSAACQRAISAAEAVAHGLMPPIDRDGDLGRALRELAARVPAGAGLGVRIECAAGLRLPVDASRDAFRIVQEALNNVLKHAAAQQVSITLGANADGAIELVVEDDGVGIAPDGAPGDANADADPGVGLGTMRYRAERAGGTLRIEPRPGGGTRVRVLIPQDSDAPQGATMLTTDLIEIPSAPELGQEPHRGHP